MDIQEYISAHSDAEPDSLYRLNRHTQLHHLYGHMCSGHYQGRLLAMLTRMIRPSRILELGTFTGYSTLCMAETMPEGCRIDTIEINDESAKELRATFDASSRGADINLHIGDALQLLPQLPGNWDMAFIDANKRMYTDYYEIVLPRITPGGFILVDNTLWADKVLDPELNHDAQTRGVIEFNNHLASDTRVAKVILPVRDGLTLVAKL